MMYDVNMHVSGRYTWRGKADSFEDANKKATNAYYNADFGDLREVDMEIRSTMKVIENKIKTFEICFEDLNENAQKEYLEFINAGSKDDINDFIPITTIELEE